MCDSRSVPKVFISLRLLLLRYESDIHNPTCPFTSLPFYFTLKRETHPVSFRNERHILLHSATKDLSYTPTLPFLSFKLIHFQSEKYPFLQRFIPFRYFIDVRICVESPNFTLPIPCLSLWSERHSFSHDITSSFLFKYNF